MIYGYHRFEAGDGVPAEMYCRSVGQAKRDVMLMADGDEVHFDDGELSAYELGLPIFEAAGKIVTFFVPAAFVGTEGHMSVTDLLDTRARGHEFGGHTRGHLDLRRLDPDTLNYEIYSGTTLLRRWAGAPCDRFVAPFERYNPDILRMIRKLGLRPVLNRTAVLNATNLAALPETVSLPPDVIARIVDLTGLSIDEVSEFRVPDVGVYLGTLGL